MGKFLTTTLCPFFPPFGRYVKANSFFTFGPMMQKKRQWLVSTKLFYDLFFPMCLCIHTIPSPFLPNLCWRWHFISEFCRPIFFILRDCGFNSLGSVVVVVVVAKVVVAVVQVVPVVKEAMKDCEMAATSLFRTVLQNSRVGNDREGKSNLSSVLTLVLVGRKDPRGDTKSPF